MTALYKMEHVPACLLSMLEPGEDTLSSPHPHITIAATANATPTIMNAVGQSITCAPAAVLLAAASSE